jgi:toxin HigB-1
MIQSFQCRETEQIFKRQFSTIIPRELLIHAHRKLKVRNAAVNLKDLSVPAGNNLKKLQGKRTGQHSIRINNQWRICFEWQAGHAYKVEIIDYH